ncbi:MAG: LPXTG cell wall anchor domain-containing protein, partial [Gallicola sp.]|nr:LPXTG cell wall anchor domain-containing protein [Gallicola sp.]
NEPENPTDTPPGDTPQSPGGTTPGGGTTTTTPGGSTGGTTTGGYVSNPPQSGKTFTGTIPKTGDIQIYLYAIAGLALIGVGSVLYKSAEGNRIK